MTTEIVNFYGHNIYIVILYLNEFIILKVINHNYAFRQNMFAFIYIYIIFYVAFNYKTLKNKT